MTKDNELLVRFQALSQEVDRLRSALENLDSVEFDRLNDSLEDYKSRIQALGEIGASEFSAVVRERTSLQQQINDLLSQQSQFAPESDDFKRLQTQIEATQAVLDELPTGFEAHRKS